MNGEDDDAASILLVDDSISIHALIRSYLAPAGYALEVAGNGMIGFEKFRQQRFDLVLMDMRMLVLDGIGATRLIRDWERQQGKRAVPILAFTTISKKEDQEASLAAGCTGYLVKPMHRDALLKAIAEAIAAGGTP